MNPDLRETAACLALCAFAYLYVFPYQEQINNPNENVRFYMTAALVEEGRYAIDGMRERWGWVNDAAVHDGHVYSVKAPGTSLLGIPGYAAYLGIQRAAGLAYDRKQALWACRIAASVLPTLAFLWFFHGWLRRRSRHPALYNAVFFSVALGSLLYGYAMLFVSHTLSAAVAFGAFMLLYDARERERVPLGSAFAAGLLAAAVTWFEYPGLVASLALTGFALAVLWPRGGLRPVAAYALGGSVPALSMMHFQNSAFGSPFTPGHLMVETKAFRAIHEQGVYGAVGPSLESLHGLLTDLGAGLFPLTPVLALGVVGLGLNLRDRSERGAAATAVALVLATVIAISSMSQWRGGWTIGPRYLAVCVPFLAWGALDALERLASRAPLHAAALAVGALATGLCASGLPSAYYPHMPPEITRPLPQLIAVLIAHDYAPPNAGALVGLFGTASMLPLFACMLGCIGFCLRGIERRARLLSLGGAALVALALGLPLWRSPSSEPGVSDAVAFITRRWSPVGHDAAAQLVARLNRGGAVQQTELETLAELYEREGRRREARRARAGKP